MWTYQEKRVRHKSIAEHSPSYPASRSLAAVGNGRNGNGDDDTDKLVARVGHQIVDLALGVDVQEVSSQPKQNKLQDDDHARIAESDAQQLRLELSVESCNHRGKQDVRCEGHYRNVDVGAVNIVPRRQERCTAA